MSRAEPNSAISKTSKTLQIARGVSLRSYIPYLVTATSTLEMDKM